MSNEDYQRLMNLYGELFRAEVDIKIFIDRKIPRKVLTEVCKQRSHLNGKIKNIRLSQPEKDTLKYTSYSKYVESLEDGITHDAIFGTCRNCAHLDRSKKTVKTNAYRCTELERECLEIMKE